MIKTLHQQLVFSVFVAFMLGVALEDRLVLTASWQWGGLVVFLLVGFVVLRLKNDWVGWVFIVFVGLGSFAHYLNLKQPPPPQLKGRQQIAFTIDEKLNNSENNRKYLVEFLGIKGDSAAVFPIKALLYLPKDRPTLDYRHTYFTQAYISRIPPPEYDFQFSYQKYMARQGVYFRFFAKQPIRGRPRALNGARWVAQQRLAVLEKIDHANISKSTRNFLKGIILADRTEMDEQITQDFARSGLAHLLAISGTHMAIIFWGVLWLLQWILPLRGRKLAIILSLGFIWAFAIFIDYGNSVVRACLMLTTYYIMILLQRKPDLLHALGLAGLVILVLDTQQLFDVGFQLSFLAVLGIYWLNKPFEGLFPKVKKPWLKNLRSIATITLSAQVITLPLVLYYFHQFSLISVVANLVILPASEVIIVFSLVLTVVLSTLGDVTWLNFLYETLIHYLLQVIHYFAGLNIFFFDNIPLHWAEVGALFLGIYYLRFLLKQNSWKNWGRFLTSVLLFFGIKLSLDFRSFQEDEIQNLTYRGRVVQVRKQAGNLSFISPAPIEDLKNFKKYVADPYAIAARLSSYRIFIINDEKSTK